MAIVYADTIEPRKPTQDITLGTTGETITLPGNDLRVNTVKDKGGNTLWTSDGSGNLSSVNSGLKGNLILLSTQTASGSASVSFTTGIDSTYDVYVFKFIDINPTADMANFQFNISSDGGDTYGVLKTSTAFRAEHTEANSHDLAYQGGSDLAQGAGYQLLASSLGNDADASAAGEVRLYGPSSTTSIKHWQSETSFMRGGSSTAAGEHNFFSAGYGNTTLAVNAISFMMSSGTFDGIIKMYGLL